MTRRLERPCLGVPGDPCGAPVVGSRCARHQAAYDGLRRPSPADRGYDAGYRADRAEALAPDALGRRPRCQLRLPGCTTWATTADHVFPVDSGRNRVRGPLRPSCSHCNSARGKRPLPDDQVEAAMAALQERDARDAAEEEVRRELAEARDEFFHPDP